MSELSQGLSVRACVSARILMRHFKRPARPPRGHEIFRLCIHVPLILKITNYGHMNQHGPDEIAEVVLRQYTALNFRPPPNQFTVLASFVLTNDAGALKIISLGTGSKCLPAIKLSGGGDALHDSHAEVIARRGAIRWLLEEISRMKTSGSVWLEDAPDGRVKLAQNVHLHLYVSTVPCMYTSLLSNRTGTV